MIIDKLKTEEINTQIRDFVNNSVIKKTSIFSKKNEGYWDQFFVALDTIEDSSIAIMSFLSIPDGDFLKNSYLNLYGVLQALFLQQDAVNHLKVSLFGEDKRIIWSKTHPELNNIRQLRNETIGHPTKTSKNHRDSNYNKDEVTYCVINRHSITREGFDYILYKYSGSDHKYIKFEKIITSQDKNLETELIKILKELKKEEKQHKKKFKSEKLSTLLTTPSLYQINLIYGVDWDDSLAWPSFDHYHNLYKKIRAGLEDRYGKFGGIIRIQGTELVIKKLDYIFSKVQSFQDTGKFESGEFEIYIDALDATLKELEIHLIEIDKEFER